MHQAAQPGPSGRSPPSAAFPDPVLGLPAPPFPLPGLEAHFHSSAFANGRCLERPAPPNRPRCAWPGPSMQPARPRAFLHLPGAWQLGALSNPLWPAPGWGRGPITVGQWSTGQVSPGVAHGLHGSLRSHEECLPQAGTVPPSARPPLESTDLSKAPDTMCICTRHGAHARAKACRPHLTTAWTCRMNVGFGGRQARV